MAGIIGFYFLVASKESSILPQQDPISLTLQIVLPPPKTKVPTGIHQNNHISYIIFIDAYNLNTDGSL